MNLFQFFNERSGLGLANARKATEQIICSIFHFFPGFYFLKECACVNFEAFSHIFRLSLKRKSCVFEGRYKMFFHNLEHLEPV